MEMERKEAPKLSLNGDESLDEIQTLMKELMLIETQMICRAKGSDQALGEIRPVSFQVHDIAQRCPDALLEDGEMVEDVLTVGELDLSRLALPNVPFKSYPADFTIVVSDPELMELQYNLLNYVKAVVNEEALSKFFFPEEPCVEHIVLPQSTTTARPAMKPQRKDSYTIARHNVPARAADYPTSDKPAVTPRLPYAAVTASTPLANGIMDKTYSTNTYSKKSSPFAVPAPRAPILHPSIPFTRNGNTVDDDAEFSSRDANINANIGDSGINNRTITRPSRLLTQNKSNGDGLKGANEFPSQNLQVQQPVKSNNLSMEEIQSLARMQQESLLSSTCSTGFVVNRTFTHDISQTSSFEEDDYSGSTGNGAWSNDTYSVGVSNPPSETSSGISSPPVAGSYEDVQLASLRRSMPNLTPKSLSLAPMHGGKLQKEAHYNSDLKLSQDRSRTRTLRAPTTMCGDDTFTLDSGRSHYQQSTESNHMEPLKKALARADTYLQGEGRSECGANNMNGYATYQVRKPSILKPPTPVSRIPAPKNAFGYSPAAGTHQEPPMASRGDSATPPSGRGGTGRGPQQSGIPSSRHQGPQ